MSLFHFIIKLSRWCCVCFFLQAETVVFENSLLIPRGHRLLVVELVLDELASLRALTLGLVVAFVLLQRHDSRANQVLVFSELGRHSLHLTSRYIELDQHVTEWEKKNREKRSLIEISNREIEGGQKKKLLSNCVLRTVCFHSIWQCLLPQVFKWSNYSVSLDYHLGASLYSLNQTWLEFARKRKKNINIVTLRIE